MALWLAVWLALAFSLTNGFHDAANAIAAVADTIAGIVTVTRADAVAVIGSGEVAERVWYSVLKQS